MQAITTTFHGPTNSRGSRLIAKCDAGRKTYPWDHSLGVEENHRAAARALADHLDWKPEHYGDLISGSTDKGYVHVFTGRRTV